MTDSELARLKVVFEERFATNLGRISAVLQSIPFIDTGHDGAEINLCDSIPLMDGSVMCSTFPYFDNGHNGDFDVSLIEYNNGGWVGPWYRFKVQFDISGQLTLFEAV